MKLKEQMKKSMFYEVTLEQRWEKIFECVNASSGDHSQEARSIHRQIRGGRRESSCLSEEKVLGSPNEQHSSLPTIRGPGPQHLATLLSS